MKNVLEINQISKNYSVIKALQQVSFNVPQGSIFGILGPNGSGKTTLLGIVLDILKANAGTYTWCGYDKPEDARKKIGSLLETPNFYHYLSAEKNLEIVAAIKNASKENIDNVLQKVNLFHRKTAPFNAYSLGMKQRLAIASALLSNPDILVLDEPTNGLDPQGITEIRELILQLKYEGKTIIMASHLLDEVEKVCTHVAILKQGNLLTTGHVAEVLQEQNNYELGAVDMNLLQSVLAKHPLIKSINKNGHVVVNFSSDINAEEINQYCFERGVILNHLMLKKRSLESKFMELIK